MKLYIPSLGDTITLAKDWIFKLHHERRNETLGKLLNLIGEIQTPALEKTSNGYDSFGRESYVWLLSKDKTVPVITWKNYKIQSYYKNHGYIGHSMQDPDHYDNVTLPTGTILRIDRVYIRAERKDFDSITFVAESIPGITCKKRPKAVTAFDKKELKGLHVFGLSLRM